ncbi:TetR/AcrR family transcriptional regulator [Shimia sp. R10_1]|uniref:TetR/AcrR family transcriptional regulator n=1 Tax=Shimia sp. R10_1 TaxID=2821095 RepID=UPI001ADCC8E4|nr:TetR/AcrR family transcriptional regulator [Shimia sp. R10_1]MBO9475478.1 TetR/AcrR family transcriptional regulator [Shimia sp. R10_1]
MARPREFNIDTALDGAMGIFWRQGYKATNLPDLLAAMGLTRGSFYKAFEDKESVYCAALDRYDHTVVTTTLGILGNCEAATATECLMPMFTPSDKTSFGCFICNAMVEVAPENPEIAKKTQDMADRLRGGILMVLENKNVGDSTAYREELADVILHLYFGFQSIGKAGMPNQDWRGRLQRLLEEDR